jgi:hypothetical protein
VFAQGIATQVIPVTTRWTRHNEAAIGSLAVLALVVSGSWACAPSGSARSHRHIDDRAALIDSVELPHLESYLENVRRESGVDIRFLFVDSVREGTLEDFTVREARALGIGRDLDRHGVLIAYDAHAQQLRIEVGPTLQDIFTDRFVGYLIREHVRSFFAAGNPTFGLRLTMRMLHNRLRRAALGESYDPRAAEFIEDRGRLATGGGATGDGMRDSARSVGFLNRLATPEARALFRPQPTVEQTYRLYLEWLRAGRGETDLPLFTPAGQQYLSEFPITPAFAQYILFLEYGLTYTILTHDSLALLYFTSDPLVSPHFFRKTAAGWHWDVVAEVRDTREYVGGSWTWTLLLQDDDFTNTFAHRYVTIGPSWRIAGGDNRPIPVSGAAVRPSMAIDTLVGERLTVAEASARIASSLGKPTVVLLYALSDSSTRARFPEILTFLRRCQSRGATIAAFSTDEAPQWIIALPRFLRGLDSPFPPVALYRSAPGQLELAMGVRGIVVGQPWRPPLIAVLDRNGRAVAQAESIVREGPTLALGAVARTC